jgi:hypothetical protein
LQSRSRAWSRSRRVLRRIWKHQNCSALTWHCVSNHWRTVPPSRSCGTARTHNISSQRNAAEEIMAGKPRPLFLPTIFQSRPVREIPIVGAASSRDRGRSVSEGSHAGRTASDQFLRAPRSCRRLSFQTPLPTRAQVLTCFPASIPFCSECTHATANLRVGCQVNGWYCVNWPHQSGVLSIGR